MYHWVDTFPNQPPLIPDKFKRESLQTMVQSAFIPQNKLFSHTPAHPENPVSSEKA